MGNNTSANEKNNNKKKNKSVILINSGDGDLFPSSFLNHSPLVHLTYFLIPDRKNKSIKLNNN